MKKDPWLAVAILLGLFLFGLVLFPQLWLIRASLLSPDGTEWTFANFARYLGASRYRSALVNSVLLATLTTALALVVAVPLAFLHARYRLPGRDSVLTLATLSTASPPFLGAYAWILLLGWNGLLSRGLREVGVPWTSLVGFHGIVWVSLWGSAGLVFLFAHDAFAGIDPDLEEAAQSLGATRAKAHLQIALPLALPGLLTAAYMTMMAVLADFGTPRLVGGPVSALPVLLYHEFLSESGANPGVAASGSLIIVGLSTLALVAQRLALAGRSYASRGARHAERMPLPAWAKLPALLATLAFFTLTFTPHLVILASSFATWRADIPSLPWTLANYQGLFERSLRPILTSYALSGAATLIAVLVGTLLAYVTVRRAYAVLSPALSSLALVPYLIPGTVLAIGMIVVFNRAPLRLTGSASILVLAYVIRKLPYATKAAEAALHQVPLDLEEAALSVGASPGRALADVTAPLILRGLVTGGTLTFLMTLTELSATLMLYAAATTTMSVVIYKAALGVGGQFGVAASTAVAMMVSVYVPLYLVRRRFSAVAAA